MEGLIRNMGADFKPENPKNETCGKIWEKMELY